MSNKSEYYLPFAQGKSVLYYKKKYGKKWKDYYIAHEIIGDPPDYIFSNSKRYFKETKITHNTLKKLGLK